MGKIAVAALALGLVALALATLSPTTQALEALLEGPVSVGIGVAAQYNVTVSGGTGGGPLNVTVKYWLTGSDLAGARPTESAPTTTTASNATRVQLNITAPTRDQIVTLVVEVNASQGPTFETTRVTKAITVVTPIVLTATFRNTSSIAALNVTVEFAVDGASVGRTRIARIDAGGTAEARVSWLPVGLAPGSHTVSATADLNGNGVIEPDLGEAQSSNLFYRTTPDLPWGIIALIVVAFLLAGMIANSAIKRRRQQGT